MNHLKIFEEFTECVVKLISSTDVYKYNQMSTEGVFSNKVYQILSYNCGINGLRVKKSPSENPTTIKITSPVLSISTYFFLRNLDSNQIIISRSIKDGKEIYLEMGYSDFVAISKNPLIFINKISDFFSKLEKDKYITPVQRLF